MVEGDWSEREEDASSAVDTLSDDRPPIYNVVGCCGKYTDVVSASISSVKRVLLAPKSKRKGPRGGVNEPFPSKLYDMLGGLESEGLTHIAAWMEHGRCFAITRQDLFIRNVMPRYFKQSKLTSFQRQMNLYGFQRVSSGVDKGCFYHPLFLRGRPDICRIMLRTRTKGNYGTICKDGDREIACGSFYDLPSCPPSSNLPSESSSMVLATEDQTHAVSAPPSPQAEGSSSLSASTHMFPLLPPYTTPVIPLPDQHGYCHTLDPQETTTAEAIPQRTPRYYTRADPTAAFSFEGSASIHPHGENYSNDDYYHTAVVSPNYGPTIHVDDAAVSMDPFWGCTFQCIDDEDVEAYDRSLDQRYQPCQP